MFLKILLCFGLIIVLNLGAFFRLVIIGGYSKKGFKIFLVVANVIFFTLAILYITGIVKI